jgi:hypothetical protein
MFLSQKSWGDYCDFLGQQICEQISLKKNN